MSKPSHAEAVKHDFGLGAENPVVEERRREETTADGSAQSPAAGMAEKVYDNVHAIFESITK